MEFLLLGSERKETASCECVVTVEVEVSLGRPRLCTTSPIHLLLAASHRGRPSERRRYLQVVVHAEEHEKRTGLAANEQTGGGG